MTGYDRKPKRFSVIPCSAVAIVVAVLAATIGAAQDLPSAIPLALPGTPIQLPGLSGFHPVPIPSVSAGITNPPDNDMAAAAGNSGDSRPVPSGSRRITLDQVKQQSANRAASPLAYMSHLSVEVARQHRLGVEADYFPKFTATFVNLHFTDFLGQIVRIRNPFLGLAAQVPVQIVNKDLTIGALSFVQPITPILVVHQAVRIARADERIAMAKAAASVSKKARDREIEETYFKLLIAQRQLISAEWKLRSGENRPLYASASADLARMPVQDTQLMEARKAVDSAAATVRELAASLNRLIGWPEDTELDLAVPEPLVESVSLQEISDKSTSANPALVEAEQTVVKARAASNIAKLAYVPTVAAVSGYLFQNAFPAVKSNVGYGGVMASYTLFDFGKREHAVKEAHAQLEMAETALQLTKAKLAADVKKSYLELERSRELSHVAQKMGSSVALLMRVSSTSESLEVKAARADMEVEMIEADFAHRQAFNRLKALTDSQR